VANCIVNYEDIASRAAVLGGIPVWGTVHGSAADFAGLRGGDIVLRVNGVPGRAVDGAIGRDAFGQLEFQVLRDGELVVIRISPELDACIVEELTQQLFGRLPRSVA
jgi:membrane-associated protease RseP (regulator of RpoE activity)